MKKESPSSTFPLGSIENPVKCKGVEGEIRYLSKLCGPEGEPVAYKRVGSRSSESGILDLYEIRYEGLAQPILAYLNMYAKGLSEKKPIPGLHMVTKFLKPGPYEKPEYLWEVIKKYPLGQEPDFKGKAIYLYNKAAAFLSRGPHVYASQDAFGYLNANWNLDGIKSCVLQYVHELRGLNAEFPIVVSSHRIIEQFLTTFHFELAPDKINSKKELFCAKAFHCVLNEPLDLWFKLEKEK